MRSRNTLLLLFLLAFAACNPATPTLSPSQPAVPTRTATATQPPVVQPSETPLPAPTQTPIPATNATTQTPAGPTIDPKIATQQARVGSMAYLAKIDQYENPVGAPLTAWRAVPIMSQATAGQEFTPNVYSFTAAATLDQAKQFYSSQADVLGIPSLTGTDSGGTGNEAYHKAVFYSYVLTIFILSHDNDSGHVIVVISKVD
jgi:hypothetical protein